MPQLSLYLDEAAMEKLRTDASLAGKTLSKYVKSILDDRDSLDGKWPQGFFDLYGALDDDSFRRPSELSWELDTPRSAL